MPFYVVMEYAFLDLQFVVAYFCIWSNYKGLQVFFYVAFILISFFIYVRISILL